MYVQTALRGLGDPATESCEAQWRDYKGQHPAGTKTWREFLQTHPDCRTDHCSRIWKRFRAAHRTDTQAWAKFVAAHPGCRNLSPANLGAVGEVVKIIYPRDPKLWGGAQTPEGPAGWYLNPYRNPLRRDLLPAIVPVGSGLPVVSPIQALQYPNWSPLSPNYPQWLAQQQVANQAAIQPTMTPDGTAAAAPTDITSLLSTIPWWAYLLLGGGAILLFSRGK